MESSTSRRREDDAGAVVLVNISNPFSGNFDRDTLEQAAVLEQDCMPISGLRFHLIYVPPGTRDQSFIETSKLSM